MAEITPVTLVTGFPGAGKTTLVDRLRRCPEFARAVVLPHALDETRSGQRLAESVAQTTIAGCQCCTMRGELSRRLREWLPLARRDEISRVIIETSGLADPVPILAAMLGDPVLVSAYRLAGIVTVIDVENGLALLDTRFEAERQVAIADRIVLRKTALADSAALVRRVRQLNARAPLLMAAYGEVAPEFVLGAGTFDATAKDPRLQAWLKAATSHAALMPWRANADRR